MKRRFVKTRGAHRYQGRSAGRGARLMSKIHKGMATSKVWEAFDQIEEEIRQNNLSRETAINMKEINK
jgi:hypothetical protein